VLWLFRGPEIAVYAFAPREVSLGLVIDWPPVWLQRPDYHRSGLALLLGTVILSCG
jgi:hypothetical protein